MLPLVSSSAALVDATFRALANSTRRAVVERLVEGPTSVSELAEPFDMALPSFLQHLNVLEDCGLVRTQKRGRVRTVRLVPDRLRRATTWLDRQRELWEQRLDRHDLYLRSLKDSSES